MSLVHIADVGKNDLLVITWFSSSQSQQHQRAKMIDSDTADARHKKASSNRDSYGGRNRDTNSRTNRLLVDGGWSVFSISRVNG